MNGESKSSMNGETKHSIGVEVKPNTNVDIKRHNMPGGQGKEQMHFWLYDLLLWTFSIMLDLFFREVHPRSSWKVPKRGPVIFVAAPHANQVLASSQLSRMPADVDPVYRPSDTYARHPDASSPLCLFPYC